MTLPNLLPGVNAHTSYDLVLTLVEVLAPEWAPRTETERHTRYVDYTYVNDVIARTIDLVQDEIVEPATPGLRLGRCALWPARRMGDCATGSQSAGGGLAPRRGHARHFRPGRAQPRRDIETATLRRAELMLGRIGS